jgi:osmotically-inducible protein OsmY
VHLPTVRENRVRCREIEEAATKCLRGNPYKGILAGVLCTCSRGVLLLKGRLSRFHHKQVAQEAVARVEGVTQVVNEIEVTE